MIDSCLLHQVWPLCWTSFPWLSGLQKNWKQCHETNHLDSSSAFCSSMTWHRLFPRRLSYCSWSSQYQPNSIRWEVKDIQTNKEIQSKPDWSRSTLIPCHHLYRIERLLKLMANREEFYSSVTDGWTSITSKYKCLFTAYWHLDHCLWCLM